MEWLKLILGDDNYKKLEENGSIEILKGSLGETEYIQNDPTKIVPKGVFNAKLEELKLEKQKTLAYEEQLKDRTGMITDEEMKVALAKKEADFKSDLKNQETAYKKEVEKLEKRQLLTNEFLAKGAMPEAIDALLHDVNYDDVVVDNGKVLNPSKVIEPKKEQMHFCFKTKVQGVVPYKGDRGQAMTKEQLIEKHNKTTNVTERMQLRRQIEKIDTE